MALFQAGCVKCSKPFWSISNLPPNSKPNGLNYVTAKQVKKLCNHKTIVWRELKASNTPSHKLRLGKKYNALRRLIRTKILRGRVDIENSIIGSGNIKQFYKYANAKMSKKSKILSIKLPCRVTTVDEHQIVEAFGVSFLASKTLDNDIINDIHHIDKGLIGLSNVEFSVRSIERHLANLKAFKTVSPDGFSAYITKLFSSSLAFKISHRFEIMFSHSYFPPEWSKAIITPVHKKKLTPIISP